VYEQVRLWPYALAAIIGASIGAGVLHQVHIQIRKAERIEQQKSTLRAIEVAQAETTRLQEKATNAQRKANQRIAANAAAAAAASSELDRLRGAIASGAGSSTCEAGTVSTDPARELLAECASAYQDLARKADAHASDALNLYDAWPR
jgi:LytS/YehU family sensor histidine kinase